MSIPDNVRDKLIFMVFFPTTRFTQDSPVYPDVWMEFFRSVRDPDKDRVDLILSPHRKSSAGELFKLLSDKYDHRDSSAIEKKRGLAGTGSTVVARLTLTELIQDILPLTVWWQQLLWRNKKPTEQMDWLKQLVGGLLFHIDPANKKEIADPDSPESIAALQQQFTRLFDKKYKISQSKVRLPQAIFSVSRNRQARISIEKSVPSTKGDSARRVFDIDGSDIAWAVLDTGIDATHPAFRKKDPKTGKPCTKALGNTKDPFVNNTRIVATYDFTHFRDDLSAIYLQKKRPRNSGSHPNNKGMSAVEVNNLVHKIETDLREGRLLDWNSIAPLLRIPHNAKEYKPPVHPHGTHVAGILGAGMTERFEGEMLTGMCPGIDLYDIRVMDEKGMGNEFNILAAIQFIRWLNNQNEGMLIHGANLSLSMYHEVASFACGQTPVCDACEKMVAEGVVVVAAAGNLGQTLFQQVQGQFEQGFRMVNITDPGNAETVITVGATHRNRPHSYGVSYFSSKGPTGDGRVKPDLVAPGEKIVSASLQHSTDRMDGTSMAAPHVSGAAALLMAKHRELIGRPRKVKEILCSTATDLGREKYFQGAGMVDVLRAIQSV